MNKIEKYINENVHNRIIEINYMFSNFNQSDIPIDKYFLARSTLVFTYGTFEKFIKDMCEYTLKLVIDNEYYNNNHVKELMQLLKYQNNPTNLFDLLMHYRNLYPNELDQNYDKGYFSRNGRVDSIVLAHIIKVLNLNRFEPILKIPKLSIDTISKKRMQLAHGDYMKDLQRFGPSRSDLTIEEVNRYIEDEFKLNDVARSEILDFISLFADKILLFLKDLKDMKGDDFKVGR